MSRDAKRGSEPSKAWRYQRWPLAGRAINSLFSKTAHCIRQDHLVFHLLNLQLFALHPDLYFHSLPPAGPSQPEEQVRCRLVQTTCPSLGWSGAAPQLSRSADSQLLSRSYRRSALGSRENIPVFCLKFLWGV